jgi:hypothetical protein
MVIALKYLVACFVCATTLSLPGITTHAQTPAAPTVEPGPSACDPHVAPAGLRWIVAAGSLAHSVPALPLEVQAHFFNSPCTFLIGKTGKQPYEGWSALGTVSLKSAAAFTACCETGVAAILYDPESWEFTPRDEQLHPGDAVCRLAALAHAQRRLVIAAPATDLMKAWPSSGAGDRYDHFVRSGIAASMAACADVYEIQAQGAEANTERFRAYVSAIRDQVRKRNPRIIVLVGLSTNPNGQSASADQIWSSVQSVRGMVDGFWLNIPAGGALCPRCGQPKPEIAAELLARLAQIH